MYMYMKKKIILLNGQRENLRWYIPIDNVQNKPTVQMKCLKSNIQLTTLNSHDVLYLRLKNKSYNIISSDQNGSDVIAQFSLHDTTTDHSMVSDSISDTTINTNFQYLDFELLNSAGVAINLADITYINLMLEMTYIENEPVMPLERL